MIGSHRLPSINNSQSRLASRTLKVFVRRTAAAGRPGKGERVNPETRKEMDKLLSGEIKAPWWKRRDAEGCQGNEVCVRECSPTINLSFLVPRDRRSRPAETRHLYVQIYRRHEFKSALNVSGQVRELNGRIHSVIRKRYGFGENWEGRTKDFFFLRTLQFVIQHPNTSNFKAHCSPHNL